MIFLLPETSRNIVGNGSIQPPRYLRLPIPGLVKEQMQDQPSQGQPRPWRLPNPLKSLAILSRLDNFIIIFACGLMYVVYTCINASLSTLFIEIYDLQEWQAGLIYLPFGLGGTVSTFFSGPLLDGAYRRARIARGLSTNKAIGDDLDNFPVERARLCTIWIPLMMTVCSVIAFGWTLHFRKVCTRKSRVSTTFASVHAD